MTIHEEVAQLVSFSAVVDLNPLERPAAGEELARRGVRTFTLYPQHMAGPTALADFIRAVRQYVPQPLFNIDQEGGRLENAPWLTSSPGNMALGAVAQGDRATAARLARAFGEVAGRELRALGIRWNFAPVGDVNINPANPVIGTRSFGEDPAIAAELVTAYTQGLQAAGVAATVKHYPGHGDTDRDSHTGLPMIPHSLERLMAVELVPFQMAARAGAEAVMTAHIAFPWLDRKPATMSSMLLSQILRSHGPVTLKVNGRDVTVPGLGFDGVIITDALEMGAIIRQFGVGEAAVQAIEAGADMVITGVDAPSVNELWQECFGRPYTAADQWAAYDAILVAVQSGRISRERLAASVARVTRLLQRYPIELNGSSPEAHIRTPEHLAVAQAIADQAVTVVRAEPGIGLQRVPASETILVVYPPFERLTPADNSFNDVLQLDATLRAHHPNVQAVFVLPPEGPDHVEALRRRRPGVMVAPDMQAMLDVARKASRIVVATYFAQHSPFQTEVVEALLRTHKPVIVVAMGNPYDLAAFPEVQNYLATYSVRGPSCTAAAKILFGQLRPTGRLPVSIPALASRGTGLTESL